LGDPAGDPPEADKPGGLLADDDEVQHLCLDSSRIGSKLVEIETLGEKLDFSDGVENVLDSLLP
jgi:hypothetical protein